MTKNQNVTVQKLLWVVRKRHPQSGERGLLSADIFRTKGKGVFQMQTSELFASDFSKIMVCPHEQEGGG